MFRPKEVIDKSYKTKVKVIVRNITTKAKFQHLIFAGQSFGRRNAAFSLQEASHARSFRPSASSLGPVVFSFACTGALLRHPARGAKGRWRDCRVGSRPERRSGHGR